MLNRLIDRLRNGGTHRVSDVARELGTTPELVEAMLETLARMGYLKQLGNSCEAQCGTCSSAGMCTAEGGGRVWALTEKGTADAL
jgi:hypothetical protein